MPDGSVTVCLDPRRPGGPSSCGRFAALLVGGLLGLVPAAAQERPIQPGEAFVTRFSGLSSAQGGILAIDPAGTVGSIIDLRSPGRPPAGEHWLNEPQRRPVTASEVGQVFGVAFDDANPPNIYVAATSAFGLHRTADNRDWMPGMWGPGGPGAIYRLDAAGGYRPRPFASVTLNGRPNSGPALGNIAFDRWNRQILVSDLETGMIHRVGLDGTDRGFFDHGTQGRAAFVDGQTGERGTLPPIAFDATLSAALKDCPTKFDRAPECWNFAPSGRRIWGLGVTRQAPSNEVRVYYAVWSSPAFAQGNWNSTAEDDKRNTVWSVALAQDGAFDVASVRREFVLPDFFIAQNDIARAGYSQPVSDISFPTCSTKPMMLVAERGGIRNLGLENENPFADPHEARLLRYERDEKGIWRAVGRYDVGFYDRAGDGPPQIRANCAGGAAFGPGYRPTDWNADPGQKDQFVWTTGDSLCSPAAPCNLGPPQGGQAVPQTASQGGPQQQADPAGAAADPRAQQDDSEVHGIQGIAEDGFEEVLPPSALTINADQTPTPAVGPDQSYLIDSDINVAPGGAPIEIELTRNDATKIGDIAIYDVCATPAAEWALLAAMPLPPVGAMAGGGMMTFVEYHRDPTSHAMVASHGMAMSHYRLGSHALELSHSRWRSHTRWFSHGRIGSHNQRFSHDRLGSHSRARSHYLRSSRGHSVPESVSHSSARSHYRFSSRGHERAHSGGHSSARSHYSTSSRGHLTNVSQQHSTERSHYAAASRGHETVRSQGHSAIASRGGGAHALPMSPGQQHNRVISRGGTHNAAMSARAGNQPGGAGQPLPAAGQGGTHDPAISRGGTHNAILSRGPRHSTAASQGGGGRHGTVASRGTAPRHSAVASRGVPRHSANASRGVSRPSTVESRGVRSHNPAVSRRVSAQPRPVERAPRFVPRVRDPEPIVRPRPAPGRVQRGPRMEQREFVRPPRDAPQGRQGRPGRGGGADGRGGGEGRGGGGGFRPF